METKKIKWLIAHEPQHLFIRTARAFAEEIERSAQGRLSIEILTTEMLEEQYGITLEHCSDVIQALTKGDIQMTQTQVHFFSQWDKNFKALDLPFLFRDHDHVTKVLEGRIGQALCKNLSKSGDMRGLAFTYSGGFRVIGSNEPITKFEDFENLRVRVNSNPVNSDVMMSIGAHPHYTRPKLEGYGYDLIEKGELDAAETTYLRFLGKHIVKTNHSMFMTTIAMNETFFQSLDQDLQDIVKEAALRASRLERQWSVEDAQKFEDDCAKNGITITTLSDEDQARFREQAMKVYEKWESYFMPGMIRHIQSQ